VFDSSGAKLLLVQAEPVLAELTSFRLELLGYQIELVGTGGEAFSSIQQSLPDLVIVDTSLPDGDGIEWIARVRGEYRADQVPVIVFSLDPSLETVERGFHAGAQDYLITPFDPTVMEEKIEALLANRHAATRRR
jgi:DNA-binding response OmpR family regulator